MALSRINANSIQDGTVVAADIADGSITTAKIADGNVTAAKVSTIANTQLTGTITTAQLGTGAVSNTKIASGAVEQYFADTGYETQFRNRIINGDMCIDQRNAGASVAISASGSTFTLDRFRSDNSTDGAITVQQVTDAPTGFVNSMKYTVTTADASLSTNQYLGLNQFIEGFNTADLMWGTANAKTITVSFWVKSSITGNYPVAFDNNAGNRYYIAQYSISSANTWEYKTVTIPGDTSGTWLTNNERGVTVRWWLGSGTGSEGTVNSWQTGAKYTFSGAASVIGTLNATWYITGVQLEVGSVATPFERRPYGTELSLCQRYYEQANMAVYSTVTRNSYSYHVPKRTNPSSVTLTTGTIVNSYEDFASFSHGSDAATTMKINAEL